jgi:hypothetical protein
MAIMIPRRNQRSSRHLDRDAAIADAQHGLSDRQIAEKQGVAPSTVFRFLAQIREEKQQISEYRVSRADALTEVQRKSLSLQAKIIASLEGDGVIASLKPSEKSGLLHTLNTVHGTCYDKERLETGQSTANVSAVTQLVRDSVKTLYRSAPKTIATQVQAEADSHG